MMPKLSQEHLFLLASAASRIATNSFGLPISPLIRSLQKCQRNEKGAACSFSDDQRKPFVKSSGCGCEIVQPNASIVIRSLAA